MSYFFLSFRNPETNTNLGVCIVQARSQPEAMAIAWEKDINPGGEVAGFELDESGFKEQGLELDRSVGLHRRPGLCP